MTPAHQYIYGPVHSWRLGISLGIDPISCKEKVCNYSCIYCQLGPTKHLETERRIFVPTEKLIKEIRTVKDMALDHLTFSGRGEPTLAANLGEMIRGIKKVRPEKIAVITNSALLHRADVQDDLAEADFVLAKLDAGSSEVFEMVEHNHPSISFTEMVEGLRSFSRVFQGKFALQIMFVAENLHHADEIAKIARTIEADEIELNTPTRACVSQCLNEEEMECIKSSFQGLPAVSIYEREKKIIEPLNRREAVRRHGRYFSSP